MGAKKGGYGKSAYLNKNFLMMCIVIFLYSFSNRLLLTPITTFGLSLGVSGVVLGILANFYEVSCMLGRPLAARSMDKGHFKFAIRISFLLIAATAALYAVTANATLYALVRFANGFTSGYTGAAMTALLPSVVDKKNMGVATSLYTALSALGASYAPALSRFLFSSYGFSAAYLAAAALSLLSLVLVQVIRFKPAEEVVLETEKTSIKERGIRRVFAGLSTAVLPVCTIGLFANITKDINDFYTVQLGLERGIDVTTGIAVAGTLSIFIGLAAGVIIDRFQARSVLIPAFLCLALSNFLYGQASSTGMATAAAILFRIGIGSYWPALLVQCCQIIPNQRGTAVATVYFFLDMVSLLNNTLLGGLYDGVGVAKMYTVVGGINLLAVVYYIFLYHFYLRKFETKDSGSS